MINISPDFEKNTIYVKIDGILETDEVNSNASEFLKICSQMKDGFSIVNDIANFKSGDPVQIDVLAQINKKIQTAFKVGKVIRVIGSSKLLLIKLLKADEKFDLPDVHYVPTLEEAEKLLAE